MSTAIEIVEVAPRDGFQSVGPIIPTDRKIAIIRALYDAGVRRMETTSFVSASAVPQLADAAEIVAAAKALPGLDQQVLVPNARHAERALAAGARHLAAFLSVSERHNLSNIRRTPQQSVEDYRQIAALVPKGVCLRLSLSTAFDCPFGGRVAADDVIALLEPLLAACPEAEIALCDTTGRADPAQVAHLFALTAQRYPGVGAWAFHGHDTYGLGAANALAAYQTGVRVFDASAAGLGGCPFAPGATGNVATEDLVWMFDNMGAASGIALKPLLTAAEGIAQLSGAACGGRVRDALAASRHLTQPAA